MAVSRAAPPQHAAAGHRVGLDLAAVITLDYRQGDGGPLAGLGGAASGVIAPLQRGVTAVIQPVGDFFRGSPNLPSLADENERLQERDDALAAQVASDACRCRAQYEELHRR